MEGKKCEFCGKDISHQGERTKFCSYEENRECHITRMREKKHAAALKRGLYCPVCGGLVIRRKSKVCSQKCAMEMASREERKRINEFKNRTHFEWPYKMPFDTVVTPADMCPLW